LAQGHKLSADTKVRPQQSGSDSRIPVFTETPSLKIQLCLISRYKFFCSLLQGSQMQVSFAPKTPYCHSTY